MRLAHSLLATLLLLACGEKTTREAVAPAEIASVAPVTSSAGGTPLVTASASPSAASAAPARSAASTLTESSAEDSAPTCERDIARMRGKFRTCYNKGLAQDPTMEGREVVAATGVLEDGTVGAATIESNTGLSAEVAECMRATIAKGPLHCAQGTGSQVRIPLVFKVPVDAGAPQLQMRPVPSAASSSRPRH